MVSLGNGEACSVSVSECMIASCSSICVILSSGDAERSASSGELMFDS